MSTEVIVRHCNIDEVAELNNRSMARNLMSIDKTIFPRMHINPRRVHLIAVKDRNSGTINYELKQPDSNDEILIPFFEIKGKNIEEIADKENSIFFNMLDYYYDNKLNEASVISSFIDLILDKVISSRSFLVMSIATWNKWIEKVPHYYGYKLGNNGTICRNENNWFCTTIKTSPHVRDGEVYAFAAPILCMVECQKVLSAGEEYFEDICMAILNGGEGNMSKYICL